MSEFKTPAKSAFEDFFASKTACDQLTEDAIKKGYKIKGWKDYSIYSLEIEDLRPFGINDVIHPFKQYDKERLQNLADSIRLNGILNPIIVRASKDSTCYEIISGHNRVEAAKLAGQMKVPAIIKDIDDDDATIMMVDSNLRQREKLMPSEKAFAYKIKLDAIKRQGARTDLSCAQDEHRINGKKSRDIIAEESGESRAQVVRYIRLTYLISELLEKVDDGSISLVSAVALSYLNDEQQGWLLSILKHDKIVPSAKQANRLKELSEQGTLDEVAMRTLFERPDKQSIQIIFKQSYLRKYFPATFSAQEIEQIISDLLENWSQSEVH